MTVGQGILGWMGIRELLVILAVAVVIFGIGRLPKIIRSARKAVGEFKKAGKDVPDDPGQADEQRNKDN